jgi:predicted nucleic acid-binding protein
MRFLLDINALIALAHTGHVHHSRAIAWYQSLRGRTAVLCTCAIVELGFLRVAVQTGLQSDVSSARKALARLKASSSIPFELIADKLGADTLPTFVRTPAAITDGHLLALAKAHAARLATLDSGIPGAVLLP